MQDPWAVAHGLSMTRCHRDGSLITTIGPPARLSRTPAVPGHPVSPPGGDAAEVLGMIGIADWLDELVEQRVIALAQGGMSTVHDARKTAELLTKGHCQLNDKIPDKLVKPLTSDSLNPRRRVLGYALGAQFLTRQFWTLSVWEGEAVLQQFVNEHPHHRVMRALQGKMAETRFVRWRLCGAELPPQWDDAFTRRDMA